MRSTPFLAQTVAVTLSVGTPGGAESQEAGASAPAVTVEVTYTGDVVALLRGGVERDVVYLDNVDITAGIDLEGLIGWRGASAFLYGLGNQGSAPSAIVGDAQGVDNIEAPTSWRLYEAWIEQQLLNARLSLLAGLYDVNSEFDLLQATGLFVNSSFGIGPEFALSRPQGPSIFPVTSLGVRVRTLPHYQVYVQAAALDGVPGDPSRPGGTRVRFDDNDGVLLVGEVGVFFGGVPDEVEENLLRRARGRRVSRLAAARYRAKIAAGGWSYTAQFTRLGPGGTTQRGNRGWYVGGEWLVLPQAALGGRGLWIVGRVGVAEEDVNRFGAYAGGALVFRGVLPSRPADEFGVGVATVHNGDPYMTSETAAGRGVTRSEIAVEAAYRLTLGDHVVIAPSLQVVRNPNTDPGIADALVAIVRTQVTF